MSGYTVIFREKGITRSDIALVKKMNFIQKHRGPDSHGYLIDSNVMMGFRGLDTTINESVKQPYSYDNKYDLVFDGNISNSIELREMLMSKGYKFSSQSDIEIISALYDYMGSDMVHELRGMFSFIIWDRLKENLLAARDPFGTKPLYYSYDGCRLLFTSEKKSFLVDEKKTNNINMEALHHYMSFQYIPQPLVLEEGIHLLEPGHILEKKIGSKVAITKYYRVVFSVSKKSFDKKLSKIRTSVEKSVEEHMTSNKPLGCLLSGGIDSTIILALAKQVDPNIKSFTVGFDNNGYSEIDQAKATADQLGVKNISKIISPQEFIKELPKIVWHMDQPLADPAAIPLYFASKEASNHVKVLLSGEGADELFGGYNIYREPYSLRGFSYLSKSLKNILIYFANHLPEGVKGKSFIERGCTPLEDRYIGNANIFKEEEKQLLIKEFNSCFTPQLITKPLYNNIKDYDLVSKMQYIDIHTWLSGDILLSADRMTMANSVEHRVPFLDIDVADIAFSLNINDKIGCHTTKYALREAFKDIVPSSVFMRPKLGFPVPIKHWLKDELYSWAKNLIIESRTSSMLNTNYAIELLEHHRKGRFDYSRKIWTILIFIIWHQIYIENDNIPG